MSFPAEIYISCNRSLVLPVKDDACLCRVQYHGHCSVRLSDAKYRPPRSKILKKLTREHSLVFRFLSQRQDEQGRLALLRHCLGMRLVSHILDSILKPSLIKRGKNTFVGFSYQFNSQCFVECFIGRVFLSKHFPKHCRIAVCRE